MVDLFEDAAEAPDEQQLSINQSYAERYQHNKRRVHLEQLQQKYGEEEGDSDESDSEDVTEDEDGEQLTPQVDAAILRTLQRIREKGSDLYDADNRVFDTEQALVEDLLGRLGRDIAQPGAGATEGDHRIDAAHDGRLQRVTNLIDIAANADNRVDNESVFGEKF